MPPLSVLFFVIIEHSVLMVLVFYYKVMSEKVTMYRTQQFSSIIVFNHFSPLSRSEGNQAKVNSRMTRIEIYIWCILQESQPLKTSAKETISQPKWIKMPFTKGKVFRWRFPHPLFFILSVERWRVGRLRHHSETDFYGFTLSYVRGLSDGLLCVSECS